MTDPTSSANGVSHSPLHMNGDSRTAPTIENDNALFWQMPVDGGHVSEVMTHPPLPSRGELGDETARLLHELSDRHGDSDGGNRPYQAWYLRWFYHTRALASQHELEAVVQEVNEATTHYAALLRESDAVSSATRSDAARIESNSQPIGTVPDDEPSGQRASLEALLVRARHDFTKAAARAGLFIDTAQPTTPEDSGDETKRRGAYICPTRVEKSLHDMAPTLPELAGTHGLRYPKSEWDGEEAESASGFKGFLARFSAGVLPIAPFILGLMVALCLGSVSGLVDIEDLVRRPDLAKVLKFMLAVALGGIVVTVLGKATESTMRILFEHLNSFSFPKRTEPLSREEKAQNAPTPRRRKSIVWVCVGALLFFGVAEAVAEGTGLLVLNDLRVANLSQAAQRQYRANPIPAPMFYLVGVLFSGAFLFYKGTDSWRKSELETLRPWLERRRQEWLEDKRASDEIRHLFELSYLIEQMESRRHELRVRLDNARATAVSETEMLHAMIEWLVSQRERMPLPTLHLISTFDAPTAKRLSNAGSLPNGGPSDESPDGLNGTILNDKAR
jgi:hypothetical protein